MLNGKAFAPSPSIVVREFGTTAVVADAVPKEIQETSKNARNPKSALFFTLSPSGLGISYLK